MSSKCCWTKHLYEVSSKLILRTDIFNCKLGQCGCCQLCTTSPTLTIDRVYSMVEIFISDDVCGSKQGYICISVLSMSVFSCLSLCLSLCLSVCLSVCLSIHLAPDCIRFLLSLRVSARMLWGSGVWWYSGVLVAGAGGGGAWNTGRPATGIVCGGD